MSAGPESPELSDYVAVIKRRRRLLLSLCLPILAIAVALAVGLPDIFVATGIIRYSSGTISGELPAAPEARQKAFVDLYIFGLASAVLSPPVLKQLLDQMPQLVSRGETRDDAMLDIIERTRIRPVTLSVLDPDSGRQRDVISEFAISFDSGDPRTAQAVAAWLTDAFIGGNRAGLKMRAEAAAQFYRLGAGVYANRITQLEGKLADFKTAHLRQLPELVSVNLTEWGRAQRDLDDTSQRLRTLQQNRIFLQAQLSGARLADLDAGLLGQLQREYNSKAATLDTDHPDMLGLRARIDSMRSGGQSGDGLSVAAQLQAERALLVLVRQRYSDAHPDVERIRRQISTLEKEEKDQAGEAVQAQSATEAPSFGGDAVVSGLLTEINAIDVQTSELERSGTALRGKVDELERRMDESPLIEHEYATLLKDIQTAHAKYDELSRSAMSLQSRISAIASGRSDELRIVRAPVLPERPTKPRRLLIVALGMVLAAALGMTTVIFREAFDQKIRGRADVYRLLQEWPLVAIPEIYNAARARRRLWQSGLLVATTLVLSTAAVISGGILLK
jgi:polysaccharide biosynthesis transport protein